MVSRGVGQGPASPGVGGARPYSDLWIVFGAFGLLALGALVTLLLQLGVPDGPPLGTNAYGVTGGLALARWVEALGYPVHLIEGRPYRLPDDMRLLMVLQPDNQYPWQDAESEELMRWVRAGGTLVIAVQNNVAYPITRRGPPQVAGGDMTPLEALGFGLTAMGGFKPGATAVRLRQPFPLSTQPWTGDFQVRSTDTLSLPVDARVLASSGSMDIVASRRLGKGLVLAFATAYPFTNEGLADENDGSLVLSLLRSVPDGSSVGFDEYHHGARQSATIMAWMLTAPAGQALLLALVLLAGYIVWTGRRMGRVFVPAEMRIRRQPIEYVVAMANLARAAGQDRATLHEVRLWLKQRLGKPYRIDASLSDEEFTLQLAAADPGLDRERLLSLLRALNRGSKSPAEFVRLARDASEWR